MGVLQYTIENIGDMQAIVVDGDNLYRTFSVVSDKKQTSKHVITAGVGGTIMSEPWTAPDPAEWLPTADQLFCRVMFDAQSSIVTNPEQIESQIQILAHPSLTPVGGSANVTFYAQNALRYLSAEFELTPGSNYVVSMKRVVAGSIPIQLKKLFFILRPAIAP